MPPSPHLHRLFSAALAAAPEHERPPAPYHGGTLAKPAFGNVGYLAIALHAVDAVAPRVARDDRAAFDAWAALARSIYARHEGQQLRATKVTSYGTTAKTLDRRALEALQARVSFREGKLRRYEVHPGQPPACVVANAAALVGYNTEVGNPADVATRLGVTTAIAILSPTRGAVCTFLTELDPLILREDMRAAILKAKLPATRAVRRCVWRGARAGKAVAWIGELDDPSDAASPAEPRDRELAIVWKLGTRFRYFEGSRADVFACVPEPLMDEAGAALVT
jgi:hypothetical protein